MTAFCIETQRLVLTLRERERGNYTLVVSDIAGLYMPSDELPKLGIEQKGAESYDGQQPVTKLPEELSEISDEPVMEAIASELNARPDLEMGVRDFEDRIMREIGLGAEYSWFNGSGSCEYLRTNAVSKLPEALENARKEGIAVATTSDLLLRTLKTIAQSYETSKYSLTNTWQALKYVIAEHFQVAHLSQEEQERSMQSLNDYLIEHYQDQFRRNQDRKREEQAREHERARQLEEEIDMTGLTYNQKQIVRDYLFAYRNNPDLFLEAGREMIDFLLHPEDYEPTQFAQQKAWAQFVVNAQGGYIYPREVNIQDIKPDKMRDVRVSVEWSYSSTLGGNAAVIYTGAEVKDDESGEWRQRQSGGVAFCLSDFVQHK